MDSLSRLLSEQCWYYSLLWDNSCLGLLQVIDIPINLTTSI